MPTKSSFRSTLADLHDFIKTAEVDDVGVYDPEKHSVMKHAVGLKLHIYAHKDQVNICLKRDNDLARDGLSVVNFVFGNDHRVDVVPVRNGVANYDSPKTLPESASIETDVYPELVQTTGPTLAKQILQLLVDILNIISRAVK